MYNMDKEQFVVSGTNSSEVKRQNARAGLSYNEVKVLLAKTGGFDTAEYSDTDREEVKVEMNQSLREQ